MKLTLGIFLLFSMSLCKKENPYDLPSGKADWKDSIKVIRLHTDTLTIFPKLKIAVEDGF